MVTANIAAWFISRFDSKDAEEIRQTQAINTLTDEVRTLHDEITRMRAELTEARAAVAETGH